MDLAQKYDQWLAAHYDPIRTKSGSISKRGGVTRYETDALLNRLLGQATEANADTLRHGKRVPGDIRQAVAEIVEAWEVDEILRVRRDQALTRQLVSGERFHRRHGRAPDGGDLEAWARRVRARLDETFCDAPLGPEALESWAKVMPVPKNNLIRMRRYAA